MWPVQVDRQNRILMVFILDIPAHAPLVRFHHALFVPLFRYFFIPKHFKVIASNAERVSILKRGVIVIVVGRDLHIATRIVNTASNRVH